VDVKINSRSRTNGSGAAIASRGDRGAIEAPARAAFASLFTGIGPEPVDDLLRTARLRVALPGEQLANPDEPDQFGVLIEGMLRTVVSLADGRTATIHYPTPVSFFGLSTIFFPVPLSVQVVRKATVIELVAADLRRCAFEHPDLGWFLTGQLAAAVARGPAIIEEFGFKTVRERIASDLITLSEPDASNGVRTAHVTQTTLAEYVGSAREVVWRCLRSLAGEGMVIVAHGSVRIVDEAGLRRVAGLP
jgi:CRP-like cAMP-binding protein